MILLESVKIERFRGIRRGEISGLTQVNVFVGRNNSGKSTVAEAIVRAAALLAQTRGGSKDDSFGRDRSWFWCKTRNEKRLEIVHWYKGDRNHDVVIEITSNGDTAKLVLSGDKESIPIAPGVDSPLTTVSKRLTAFLPGMGHVPSDDVKLWEPLLMTRSDKVLIEVMAEVFDMPDLESIQQTPVGKLMVLFKSYAMPLDSEGDGARAALRCLLPLAQLQDTLYIIEEPEVHQHPGSLQRFARALCQLGQTRKVQLLITTHSLECVSAFIDGAEAANSDSAVFHLSLKDGDLTTRKIDAGTVRSLDDMGTDVRKLDLYA